jgi:predicted AAA+ superfamily ATPase
MVDRPEAMSRIKAALRRSPIVALIGSRQCGKTTLARKIIPAGSPNYFDLENPVSVARLAEPMTALHGLKGVVVLDEVQRRDDLFPVLRVLADRKPLSARFLVLGSASPALLRQSSETLAGRIEVISLSGFVLPEVGMAALDRHWLRGGFPRSFLARSNADSYKWREQFIRTFVERDIPQLGIRVGAVALLRFWTMLAHYHAQIWNAAEPARSLGVSEPTVRHYLDLLTDVFMVRQLPPWHENLAKRQVKAPKILLRDAGILHQLLGIRNASELLGHPKSGASWEGYATEQILHLVQPDAAYFWATYAGAELDLLLFKSGRRLGVEIKRADAPTLTPSMRTAMQDLKLEQLVVLYPGKSRYQIAERVFAVPLTVLAGGTLDSVFPRMRRARQR